MMNTLKVKELFLSAQGEGPDVGVSTVFLRLAGCNIACKWCDTKYALTGGEDIPTANVMKSIIREDVKDVHRVYITGGEPLTQQKELYHLITLLIRRSYRITIATNGTIPPPKWQNIATWDIDCKCPSSGVAEPFSLDWCLSGERNRIKFVVGSEEDLMFVREQLRYPLFRTYSCPELIVSPVMPCDTDTHARYALVNRPWLQEVWNFAVENNLRFSLQAHKIVFGDKKGV